MRSIVIVLAVLTAIAGTLSAQNPVNTQIAHGSVRQDLFNFQEDAGDYEFWGEYVPPKLTTEDASMLEGAGVHFPRVPMASTHLRFKRLN